MVPTNPPFGKKSSVQIVNGPSGLSQPPGCSRGVKPRAPRRSASRGASAKVGRRDGEVGISGVLGDGEVGVAGVEIDRLRTDEHESVSVVAERLDGVEQCCTGSDVERSGTPGILVPAHPIEELISL